MPALTSSLLGGGDYVPSVGYWEQAVPGAQGIPAVYGAASDFRKQTNDFWGFLFVVFLEKDK